LWSKSNEILEWLWGRIKSTQIGNQRGQQAGHPKLRPLLPKEEVREGEKDELAWVAMVEHRWIQRKDESDVEGSRRYCRGEVLGDSGQKPGGILDSLVLLVRKQPKE